MNAVVDAPPSRRIKELEGNDHLEYSAGHFLTIDPHQFEALERFTAFLESRI